MPTATKYKDIVLSPSDVERLYRIAPWFDVHAQALDGGFVQIRVDEGPLSRVATVTAKQAVWRVLTEVCEKTLRWVYFHEGEHCAQSLLRHTDARLQRIAELYRQKGAGFDVSADVETEEAAMA